MRLPIVAAFAIIAAPAAATTTVSLDYVSVKLHELRPGTSYSHALVVVTNRSNQTISAYMRCDFYRGGVPIGTNAGHVQAVPAGDQALAQITVEGNATEARCRPTTAYLAD